MRDANRLQDMNMERPPSYSKLPREGRKTQGPQRQRDLTTILGGVAPTTSYATSTGVGLRVPFSVPHNRK